MAHDPTIYEGSAAHYLKGRPPCSAALLSVLGNELAWDATGTLLDVGCGLGVLAVQLAPGFGDVVALDPDPAMLAEGERHARAMGRDNVVFVRDVAEHLGRRGLGPTRAMTFGQSLHWMDRARVIESVYDALEPGGSIIVVGHDKESASHVPDGIPVPGDAVKELIRRYLGAADPTGAITAWSAAERHEHVITRSRFGTPRVVVAPGARAEWDEDAVVSMYLSMSFCSPHLFRARLGDFVIDLRRILRHASPGGRFAEFPGDTVALIATKDR